MTRPAWMVATAGDLIVAGGLAVLGVYLAVAGAAPAPGGAVEIRSSRGGLLTVPLASERIVDFPGNLGLTRIDISHGQARFLSSPCAHKLCVRRGPAMRSGEWIACVPNGVVATVKGKGSYDAVTP